MGKRLFNCCIGLTVLALSFALPAQATVTIGSNKLELVPNAGVPCGTAPCTASQSLLAGIPITSPVNGVVVRWRTSWSSPGMARLRIIRPLSPNPLFVASSPAVVVGTSPQANPTVVSIAIGDRIGLDDLDAGGNHSGYTTAAAANIQIWDPNPPDGTAPALGSDTGGIELALNADIEPTAAFTVGAVTRNRKKGTANLAVTVPNPGELAVAGKGVKPAGGAARAVAVNAPGLVSVLVKAQGKKRRQLNKAGKVKVTLSLTFTPAGGTAASQTRKLKLKKN